MAGDDFWDHIEGIRQMEADRNNGRFRSGSGDSGGRSGREPRSASFRLLDALSSETYDTIGSALVSRAQGRAEGGLIGGALNRTRDAIGSGLSSRMEGRARQQELDAARADLPYIGTDRLGVHDMGGWTNPFDGYRAGDEVQILNRLTTEDLVRVQQQLIRYGFISEARMGKLDDDTVKGFKSLLSIANREGKQWTMVMNDLRNLEEDGLLEEFGPGGGGGGAAPVFEAPAYLAPDYATLAQEVKGLFRRDLGRDPDDSELAALTAELDGFARAAYDQQVEAARAEFDGRGAEHSGTQVDPAARFREMFEERFASELDFVEDKDAAVESREIVEGGVGTLSQMTTRGGI